MYLRENKLNRKIILFIQERKNIIIWKIFFFFFIYLNHIINYINFHWSYFLDNSFFTSLNTLSNSSEFFNLSYI